MSESTASQCDICKDKASLQYIFNCKHKICSICLYHLIFTQHIHQFADGSTYKIPCDLCKDDKFSLILNSAQVYEMLRHKATLETKKISRKKCDIHTTELGSFCHDCNELICTECSQSKDSIHNMHHIENTEQLSNKIKHFFSTIDKKFTSFEKFSENIKLIGKEFKEVIEGSYESTLKLIDNLLLIITNFRSEYVTHYKRKLDKGILNLKLLKLLYLNYYYDMQKCDDTQQYQNVHLFKYLNNINLELDNVKINHNTEVNQKLLDMKKTIESLRKMTDKYVSISFAFKEVPKTFKNIQHNLRAHNAPITGILPLQDNSFITVSQDYAMKHWEMNKQTFKYECVKEYNKLEHVALINCDKKYILCSNSKTAISIWKYDNDRKDFHKEYTLAEHEIPIADVITIHGDRIVSSDSSGTIKIWEEKKHTHYSITQTLNEHQFGAVALCGLFDGRIASGGGDDKLIIWKESINSFGRSQILKGFEGRMKTIVQLKDTRLVCAGENKWIFVWEEKDEYFQEVQKFKSDYKIGINLLFLLDNGNFIAVSKDTNMTIWKINKEESNNKDKGMIQKEEVIQQDVEVCSVSQVSDGMVVSSGKDGGFTIWRNRKC